VKYVLFVCTHNAGRSQMAQAFFEKYAPHDFRAESGGEEPAEAIARSNYRFCTVGPAAAAAAPRARTQRAVVTVKKRSLRDISPLFAHSGRYHIRTSTNARPCEESVQKVTAKPLLVSRRQTSGKEGGAIESPWETFSGGKADEG